MRLKRGSHHWAESGQLLRDGRSHATQTLARLVQLSAPELALGGEVEDQAVDESAGNRATR